MERLGLVRRRALRGARGRSAAVITGELDHRPELPILLALTAEAAERVGRRRCGAGCGAGARTACRSSTSRRATSRPSRTTSRSSPSAASSCAARSRTAPDGADPRTSSSRCAAFAHHFATGRRTRCYGAGDRRALYFDLGPLRARPDAGQPLKALGAAAVDGRLRDRERRALNRRRAQYLAPGGLLVGGLRRLAIVDVSPDLVEDLPREEAGDDADNDPEGLVKELHGCAGYPRASP